MINLKTTLKGIFINIITLTPQKMILKYTISILKNINMFYTGSMLIKMKASITLGILLSPVVFGFNMIWNKLTQWSIDNSDYVLFVMFAIIVDHLLGSLKHLIHGTFSMKKNVIGFVIKFGLVVAMGLLFEGMSAIVTHDSIIKQYVLIVTRLIVFLYPAGSAFKTSSILSGGKFPPKSWLEKMNRFERDLDPKDLAKKKEI